jgi:N-acetylglutamate synthase-like GNAT family acetyltransferase
VGAGGLYDHGGVAELGGASTLAAFRRRGVQSALVARRLADAYALGCDSAMVVTAPGATSQRNLQRLGFVVAYTKTVLARANDISV